MTGKNPPDSCNATSLLVYHAGALGDFITILPVLKTLRRRLHHCRVTLLGYPQRGELGALAGCIESTIDCRSALVASLFSGCPSNVVMQQFAQFKRAVLFAAPGNPIQAGLEQCGMPSIDLCLPFPQEGDRHVVDYHLSALTGESHAHWDDSILFGPGYRESGDGSVCIHPGSGSPRKNWPLERFVAIAGLCERVGIGVTWLVGPAETALTLPFGQTVVEPSPQELVLRLSAARVFIGNDSGVAHVAGACGTPTVALFGSSDPNLWAPRGPRVAFLKSPTGTMDGIGVRDVTRACEDFGIIL